MMCTMTPGKSTCGGGDEGVPIFASISGGGSLQVGVESWGIGCGTETIPRVAARVSSAYDWIMEQTTSPTSTDSSAFSGLRLFLSVGFFS
mmetsp:Transcript_22508/g.28854  ORF Transcript_22508/g.28854 Transcript_22508/m.28854 type:complete len:90 (-) Transcript_22508:127-396(-)